MRTLMQGNYAAKVAHQNFPLLDLAVIIEDIEYRKNADIDKRKSCLCGR